MPDFSNRNFQLAAHDTLAATLRGIAFQMAGFRAAPADMLAELADRGVRRSELAAICRYVQESWPDVVRISAAADAERPSLRVETNSLAQVDHRRHWPLATHLKATYPTLADFTFFIHGPVQISARATLIYPQPLSPSERTAHGL